MKTCVELAKEFVMRSEYHQFDWRAAFEECSDYPDNGHKTNKDELMDIRNNLMNLRSECCLTEKQRDVITNAIDRLWNLRGKT